MSGARRAAAASESLPRLVIVGKGRLGSGLAKALRHAGVRVRTLGARASSREARPRLAAEERVVVLAVADPYIAELAASLAPSLAGRVVLHVAGGLGVDALAPARDAGAHTGVMHPLVSFADARRAPDLRDTSFLIAGDARARTAAKRIARSLGAHPVEADVHGATYHAAAALVANGSAALAARATLVFEELGLSRPVAERALGALLVSVGQNIARVGLPVALTGPVVRGDADAVRRHRAALGADARAAYDAITPLILALALEAGLPEAQAASVRRAMAPGIPTG